MGFSLVALVDGAPDCGAESTLGYGGLVLWTAIMLYLMMGLYLVCEHHFVPSLGILGRNLGLSEDAQGATIMAAGSSSPEFFTALIGVLFYTHDNPGPGTIVGSAVFNVCIIIGCSAIFAPRPLPLEKFPLYRDSLSYLVASLMLLIFYKGITPGYIDMGESLCMWLSYVLYTLLVTKRRFVLSVLRRICGDWEALAYSEPTSPLDSKSDDAEAIELKEVQAGLVAGGVEREGEEMKMSEFEDSEVQSEIGQDQVPYVSLRAERPMPWVWGQLLTRARAVAAAAEGGIGSAFYFAACT